MTMKYIAVRHSAFGYNGDERFERGLEVRPVLLEVATRMKEKGAAIFDTYREASDFCRKECAAVPHPTSERLPNAQGMFARALVDGLQVYIPAP